MRVLFDGFWWTHGPIANRTVMRELVFAWARTFPTDEILIAARKKHASPTDLPPSSVELTTRLAPQSISNVFELPVLALRNNVDLVVSHNFAAPVRNSCVFIHDLLFEESPQWFTLKERLYFWPMSRLARFASVVLTSSRTEAIRIERLHPNLAPVFPTDLAVAPTLANSRPVRPAFVPPSVRGFILCVGRLNARKNLATTIRAASASGVLSAEFPLIIVGSSEYSGNTGGLPEDIQQGTSDGKLVFSGRISDGELNWLYRHCDSLIFMSRDEGFGLPPIEAAYFGAPAIVSDIPVMREVAPKAVAFVEPDNVDGLAYAISSLAPRETRENLHLADVESAWNSVAIRFRDAAVTGKAQGESS